MDNNVNIFDNERLNDIYQKVVNGEITSTAGLNLTLDELFTMDKNGDFLLIDLLENNVDIDLKNGKIRNNGSVFFILGIFSISSICLRMVLNSSSNVSYSLSSMSNISFLA